MTPEHRLQWIHEAQGRDDLRQRYDEWASEYDAHLVSALDYKAPDLGVAQLAKRVPTSARILDVEAGTGLVGQRLHAAGYRDIVALDYSAGMLEKAREKGVYLELRQEDLLGPLSFSSASFDAAIVIGVFHDTHVSVVAFNELIRVIRRGGVIVVSLLRSFHEHESVCDALKGLEQAGKWRLVEREGPFAARKSVGADAPGAAVILVYEVC